MTHSLSDTIALARRGDLDVSELVERFLDADVHVDEPSRPVGDSIPVFTEPRAGGTVTSGREVILAAPRGHGIVVDPAGEPFEFAPFIVDAARRGVLDDAS